MSQLNLRHRAVSFCQIQGGVLCACRQDSSWTPRHQTARPPRPSQPSRGSRPARTSSAAPSSASLSLWLSPLFLSSSPAGRPDGSPANYAGRLFPSELGFWAGTQVWTSELELLVRACFYACRCVDRGARAEKRGGLRLMVGASRRGGK